MSAFRLYQAIWIIICCVLTVWFVEFNARAGEVYSNLPYGSACRPDDRWRDCDPMAMTGFLAVIVGLWITTLADRSQVAVLRYWYLSGIVDRDPTVDDALMNDLRRSNIRWQAGMLLFICLAAAGLGFVIQLDFQLSGRGAFLEYAVAFVIGGFAVGARMGRAISHGSLGKKLGAHDIRVQMTPGHPDATGGIGAVGNFYLVQALPSLLPIIYLTVWIVLARSDPKFAEAYGHWVPNFSVLLIIGIAVFAGSFGLPLVWFRWQIAQIKKERILPRIMELRAALDRDRAKGKVSFFDEPGQADVVEWTGLMRLPDWPISPSTRRVFLSSMLLPLLSGIAGLLTPALVNSITRVF